MLASLAFVSDHDCRVCAACPSLCRFRMLPPMTNCKNSYVRVVFHGSTLCFFVLGQVPATSGLIFGTLVNNPAGARSFITHCVAMDCRSVEAARSSVPDAVRGFLAAATPTAVPVAAAVPVVAEARRLSMEGKALLSAALQ